jgi:formylmethanofuran dehydrogenase subunit D
MAPQDMRALNIADGDRVRMWNAFGSVEVPVEAAKGDELPPGLLFISYGDISSQLMGGETHGSGMPDSKGFEVWVERVE